VAQKFLSEKPKLQSRLNPKRDNLLRVGDGSLKTPLKNILKEKTRGLNFLGGSFASNLQENEGLVVPGTDMNIYLKFLGSNIEILNGRRLSIFI
jgi:hypothetical protein